VAFLRSIVNQWSCRYAQKYQNRTGLVDSIETNLSKLVCPPYSHNLPALTLASHHALAVVLKALP
jgi:hypothetical protein